MTLSKFTQNKLQEFDNNFGIHYVESCDCCSFIEKPLKDFLQSVLKELAETIATDYKKGFLEMNRNYIISTRLNTNANRLGKFVIPEEEYWGNLEEFIKSNGTE